MVTANYFSCLLAAAASALLPAQFNGNSAGGKEEQFILGAATPIFQTKKSQPLDVKSCGAQGDGITDDTPAFNKALALCATNGGTCMVPEGTYLLSASGITSHLRNGVHLVGEGHGVSILKIAAMPTGALIFGDGDDWTVENLTLDMQDYYPARNYSAIACKGNNWRIAHCSIIRMGRIGIAVAGGNNWSIENDHISKTQPIQTLNQSILVTKEQGNAATNARIVGNICDGSGILFWGFTSVIAQNRISRAGFGSGIATGQAANCRSLQVVGNTCFGGRGFDENRTWVSGFELWGADSLIAENTAYDNGGSGFIVGGQNCIVKRNRSYNNGVQDKGYGFSVRYQNSIINGSHSVFMENLAYDTRYPGPGMTQSHGYHEQLGVKDIRQIRNSYDSKTIEYNSR